MIKRPLRGLRVLADVLEYVLFASVAGGLALVIAIVVSALSNWYRARKVMAFIVAGDTIIPRPAKITEEGVEVDGKVYAAPRDAFKIMKYKGRYVLSVFLDANSNAAYKFSKGNIEREAPPELLSSLALKRILRQLTRREVQILPFILGIAVGLLVLTAGAVVMYQHVIVPAEQKAAAANQVLNDYNSLKTKYENLLRENQDLKKEVEALISQLNDLQNKLQACRQPVNETLNATTGG